eukprot:Skav222618  [mRNA]  locus=scaffold4205:14375:28690:+ [translate_table: standard]
MVRWTRKDVADRDVHVEVAAEPLVQLADLTRFLTKVTPCVDEAYLQFCHRIIGHRIRDLHSDKDYEVTSFEIYALGLPIPIHTVTAIDGDAAPMSWVLANRAYTILGNVDAANVAQLEVKVARDLGLQRAAGQGRRLWLRTGAGKGRWS